MQVFETSNLKQISSRFPIFDSSKVSYTDGKHTALVHGKSVEVWDSKMEYLKWTRTFPAYPTQLMLFGEDIAIITTSELKDDPSNQFIIFNYEEDLERFNEFGNSIYRLISHDLYFIQKQDETLILDLSIRPFKIELPVTQYIV